MKMKMKMFLDKSISAPLIIEGEVPLRAHGRHWVDFYAGTQVVPTSNGHRALREPQFNNWVEFFWAPSRGPLPVVTEGKEFDWYQLWDQIKIAPQRDRHRLFEEAVTQALPALCGYERGLLALRREEIEKGDIPTNWVMAYILRAEKREEAPNYKRWMAKL